ncbi:MAG: 6-phosphofructokinase [Gemmatimonadales bacterium]|nr:6-phosphofructokinase [Gemmatimonadales bacterium]
MALKGNVLVGQSGGPTAVINASLAGVVEQAMQQAEIGDIYGAVHGVQGILDEDLCDLRAETAEAISLLAGTPAAALGSCRKKLSDADYARLLAVFRAHDIRYFFYIGGNDSADTTHQVGELAKASGWEMRVIGVPKTVDNDLGFTDHCPGYGSVARFNALAVQGSGLDTAAMSTVDTVKIFETMGRNAGWITAATALARQAAGDPPHLIYLPERVFEPERFLADVTRVVAKGEGCVVAVCEGLKNAEGDPIVTFKHSLGTDSFGHKQLGGVGEFLVDLIASELGLKARSDKSGTIQRSFGAAQSPVDAAEARMAGAAAVQRATEGVSDQMITLVRTSNSPYQCTTGTAPLAAVANAERPVPDEFINAEGNDVTPAFLDYARPLIGDPLPPVARLKLSRVAKKL